MYTNYHISTLLADWIFWTSLKCTYQLFLSKSATKGYFQQPNADSWQLCQRCSFCICSLPKWKISTLQPLSWSGRFDFIGSCNEPDGIVFPALFFHILASSCKKKVCVSNILENALRYTLVQLIGHTRVERGAFINKMQLVGITAKGFRV